MKVQTSRVKVSLSWPYFPSSWYSLTCVESIQLAELQNFFLDNKVNGFLLYKEHELSQCRIKKEPELV